jgi:hypothetical protein
MPKTDIVTRRLNVAVAEENPRLFPGTLDHYAGCAEGHDWATLHFREILMDGSEGCLSWI